MKTAYSALAQFDKVWYLVLTPKHIDMSQLSKMTETLQRAYRTKPKGYNAKTKPVSNEQRERLIRPQYTSSHAARAAAFKLGLI